MKKKFEFLEHTADIKIRAYGKTISEVFESMTLAVSNYLSNGEKISSKKGKVIEVFGEDNESLLYNYIEELIYLLDAESFITAKAEITIRGTNLKAELFGDNAENYTLDHIKAPTYAEMEIKKTALGWEAQAVLDV